MRAELDLTPIRAAASTRSSRSNRPRTDAVLDRFLPQLRALTDSIRVEVRDVLTPPQQEIFDRIEPPLVPPPLRPPRPPDNRHPPEDRPPW